MSTVFSRLAKRDFAGSLLILGAVIFVLVFLSFRGSLGIRFGPIDDHEILKFLGTDRKVFLYQVPSILWQQTEIGHWGEVARFRPSYYFLRVIETLAFERRSYLWYLNRIIILFVTVFSLSRVVFETVKTESKAIKVLVGLFFAISSLRLPGLVDTTMRLGPAETYLLLGLAGFLISSVMLFRDETSIGFWNLNLLSVFVAVGSKENAVALIVPFMYVLFRYFKANSIARLKSGIQGAFVTLFSLIIVLGPIKFISQTGTDVYGSSRSIENMVSLLVSFFETSAGRSSGIQILTIFICLLIQVICRPLFEWKTRAIIFLTMSLYFILITEFIFYQGDFGEPRYALLSQISSIMIKTIMIITIIDTAFSSMTKPRVLIGCVAVIIIFLSEGTLTNYSISARGNNAIAKSKIQTTRDYQDKVSNIGLALQTGEYSGVLVQIDNVWNYEPAYAISQYLAILGTGLPVSININIEVVAPGLETVLLNQLMDFQENGSSEWKVKPKRETLHLRNLCIVFNGALPLPNDCLGALAG